MSAPEPNGKTETQNPVGSSEWFCRGARCAHRNLDVIWLAASMAAFGHGLDSVEWWVVTMPTAFLIAYSARVKKRQNDKLTDRGANWTRC